MAEQAVNKVLRYLFIILSLYKTGGLPSKGIRPYYFNSFLEWNQAGSGEVKSFSLRHIITFYSDGSG